MKRRTMLLAAAGVVAAALAIGWAFAPRAVEVEVAQVVQGRFERTIDEDARTRLAERYVVSAPLAGRLARIGLREGDAVAAGDPVAGIAPVLAPLLDERTQREQRARVEAAEALLQRAGVRIERARVSVEQARADLRRSEQLARDGFVAPTKLDTDRLAVQASQKELESAEAERHVAAHELQQARAALLALRPGGAPAAGFVVRAPIAGRVLRVAQTSETTVALGAPLLELGDTSRLEVVAELLTADALQAQPGTHVRIERWGGPGVLDGRVRRVEPAAFTKVSALGVEEQRVNVLIDIESPHAQWRALGDGYRVAVRIVVQAVEPAVLVPVSAVFPQAGAPGAGTGRPDAMAVFVVDGGRARLQAVTVGARNGAQAWVTSGLAPGTSVIVYPPATVRDGVRVRERKV